MIGNIGRLGNLLNPIKNVNKGKGNLFHKSLVDYWNFKGKRNFDKDRNTIKGVKDNILNAYNFGWSLGSGYGKYTMNYLNYLNNSKSPEDIIITDSSITRLKGEGKISFWVTGNKLPTGITVIPSYRINVTGEWETPPEFTYYDGDNASISHTITLTHGINIIPEITINVITSISSTIYGFSTFQNGDVTIEQIPEYEGAIVTDGVDDYLKLGKIGYKIGTVIVKYVPIKFNVGWNTVFDNNRYDTPNRNFLGYSSIIENRDATMFVSEYGDYLALYHNTPKQANDSLYISSSYTESFTAKDSFSMALYDIAIYQDVLTAEEIQKEINVMKYGTPNPVFALNFDNFAYKAVDYPEFATGKVTTNKIVVDSTTETFTGAIALAKDPEATTGDPIEVSAYKLKVTGIDSYNNPDGIWGIALMPAKINDENTGNWDSPIPIYKDGVYDIPAILKEDRVYNMGIVSQIVINKPIEIEILYDKNITKSFPETKQILP